MLTTATRRGLPRLAALSRAQVTAASAQPTPAPQLSAEWARARPFEDIPGPSSLPVIGPLLHFLPPKGELQNLDAATFMFRIRERYGDIVRAPGVFGRPTVLFLFNPNDIEMLYRREGSRPERMQSLDSLKYYVDKVRAKQVNGVQSLAFSVGDDWYNVRRRVNPTMMQPRATKMYVPAIDDVAQEFVKRMAEIRDENMKMPTDFMNELNKWALESIVLIALDTRLGCLKANLPPDSEPQRMIQATHDMFDSAYKLDLEFSPWRYISTPAWRRLVKAMDYFGEVAARHTNEAMERIKARGPEAVSNGELSVLEKLLLSSDDPNVAVVMALDMIGAGIDTTSNASATALYFLSKSPEAQEKLFQELKSVLPESPSQPLTPEKLEACKYLKACIKESMRLKPVVTAGSRRVTVDDLVLSGYRVPRGVNVVSCNAVLTNSEQHYPRAGHFEPERWLKDSSGNFPAQSTHPFTLMPFGFGPRMCIGRRFAELEIHTLVARIMRRYKLEFDGEMQWKMGILHGVGSPLTFKVTDRPN